MLNKKFKKVVSSVTMFATVVCLSGVSMLAPLSANAATLVDGDLVKSNATNSDGTPALSSLDIYIVKMVGTKQFKRLVLNPQIFASYGHLKWENIKTVSQAEIDALKTSSLVRVDGTEKVYALTPVAGGDTGAKSWVNVTADQFINGAGSDSDSIYTINSTDFAAYSAKGDITTVTALKAFYKDGTLPASVSDGALKVALSADSAEAGNVPTKVGVEFAKFNFTASEAGDVNVDSIVLTAGGLEDGQYIKSIALYDEDGNRLNSNLANMGTDGDVNVNINDLIIKAGTTEEVTVKAAVDDTKEGVYTLLINSADDINSDAASVSGSFPIEGNEMNAVDATGVAVVTISSDGTPSGVDLGDEGAILAKFKLKATVADATVSRISLKRSNIADSAADADFENLALYVGSTKVAEADEIVNKYVTFNIAGGIDIEEDDTAKLSVRGDVIGGAGKNVQFVLDNVVDIEAAGTKFPAQIAGTFAGASVAIAAGEVTLEKVYAASDKIKAGTENVELGTIKVTANSGEDVNIEKFQIRIVSTGDSGDGDVLTELTNVEIYDATDKSTYDLTYDDVATDALGTSAKLYNDEDINIEMASGETHEFIVRGDTAAAADANTYTVSMVTSSTEANSDLVIKEVVDDTFLGDITPTSITLKKATVEAAGITFTKKALSVAKNAVAGSDAVEAIRLDVEAEASDITINELRFTGSPAGTTLNDDVVSGFALYELGNETAIKTVGTSELSGEEVTFGDLAIDMKSGEVNTYYVTVDIAENATGTIQLALSGYDAEDADDTVYDSVIDNNTADGDVDADHLALVTSGRTITIVGVGTLEASIDNTLTSSKKDVYLVAGKTSDVLAALKLKATNEDVDIDSIKLTINDTDKAQSVFSRLYLVDADGKEVATSTGMVDAAEPTTVTFDEIATTISGEEYLYLKGVTNAIGQDEVGAINQTGISFQFSEISATGASSLTELSTTPGTDTAALDAGEIYYEGAEATAITAASKITGVLASKISSVELVTSGGGYSVASTLSGGEQIIAIIKVTTDASTNDNAGTTVKTALSDIIFGINKASSATGTAITAASIQNADSSTDVDASAPSILTCEAADTTSGLTFTGLSGADFEIAPGSTEYFLVKATVSLGTGDDYVQAKLANMDGTDATASFAWKDTAQSGVSTKYALRLGYASLTGATISE